MAKIKWNTVTWYSKLLAVFLLFVLLYLSFYFGSEFQKTKIITNYYQSR